MRTVLIMNEQHKVLPQQEELLKPYQPYEVLKIPASGLSVTDQQVHAWGLVHTYDRIIFLSPVPVMLGKVASHASQRVTPVDVFLFANDKREKKELPNGKIISVVARDGWQLVEI